MRAMAHQVVRFKNPPLVSRFKASLQKVETIIESVARLTPCQAIYAELVQPKVHYDMSGRQGGIQSRTSSRSRRIISSLFEITLQKLGFYR